MSERLDVHLHICIDPETLGFLNRLMGEMKMLRDKLNAAVAASQAVVTSETDLKAALVKNAAGEADRTAAAVAKALDAAGVEEDAAADLITQASTDAKAGLADMLTSITANTGETLPPPPADTLSGGQGDDSLPTGGDTNTDTIVGGNADDTLSGGNGTDTIDPTPAPISTDPDPVPPVDPNAQ